MGCECPHTPNCSRSIWGVVLVLILMFLLGLLTGHLCVEEVRVGLGLLWVNPDLRLLSRFG